MTRAPGPDGNASPAGLAGVTVVIENLAPANGTWLTPVWVGLHDGTFDPFDAGAPASTALERLAEDGNTTPLEQLFDAGDAGHVQAVVPGSTGNPQLAPGESATHTFIVDPTDPTSQFLGLLSMVIPSNDAFIGADDPQAHRIFTAGGEFLGAFFTIEGTAVRDAGTEVNDEIPEHTAFFGQTVPNSGVDEGGVVHTHPGYLPPGSGGILDDPMFAAADFTQPGYDVARVTVYRSDTVVPTGTVSGTWSADGSPYLIEGDVTVPAGQTLMVEPGVIVYTLGGHGILVEGTLEATGTAASPILFTGDANGSGTDGWTGLRFENTTTTSRLEHCIVEHGDRYSTYESGGGLACIDASLELRSSTVRDNQAYLMGAGLYCSGGDLLVEDCRFSGNLIDGISSAAGGGIYCENADPVIRRTRFEDNRVLPFDQFGTSNARGGALALDHCGGLVERC
ncbi:MAG: spondin domain-containing protein, partial [Candidatus Eiseniibacteriota bacterium]